MKIIYLLPSLKVSNAPIIYEQAEKLEEKNHKVIITSLNEPTSVNFYPLKIIPKKLQNCLEDFKDADAIIGINPVTAFYINDIPTEADKYYYVLNNELNFYNKETFKMKYPKLDKDRLKIEVKTQKRYLESSYQLPINYLLPNLNLISLIEQYNDNETHFVPIGIDLDKYYAFNKAIPSNKRIRITIEGNPLPWKGIDDLKRGLSNLRGFQLWVITDSKPGFIKADKYWRNPNVKGLRKIFTSSDIFIKSYRYDDTAEMQAKAMACGCPVITTETNGSKVFCNNKNSIMVEPENHNQLGKAIKDLLNNKEKREKLSREGLETVKELSIDNRIKFLESALEKGENNEK